MASFWQKNINRFSCDESFGFILTGCSDNYCQNNAWGDRILPIIDSLPTLFSYRYIKWPENFVEAHNEQHIDAITEQFRLPKVMFDQDHGIKIPVSKPFVQARIDGLIPGPDDCVGDQCREIRLLCRTFGVYYWQRR